MAKTKVSAGGEKHVVYKKTTKRGEGKVGDIMVSLAVFIFGKGEWHRVRIIGFALHLVDVPFGIQKAEVDHTDIGAYALYLLGVPEREGIVIPIGKQDGIGSTGIEIIFGHGKGSVTA